MRVFVISVLVVGIVACGGDSPALDTTSSTLPPPDTAQSESTTSTTSTTSTPPQPVTTLLPARTTSTSVPPTTTAPEDPETPTTTAPSPTLPGQPIDLGWPASGDVLAVIGVAHDDVLNLRQAPGTDQTILAGLSPTAADLVATGRSRSLPNSIWHEVAAEKETGWVSGAFVAYAGATDDVTAGIVSKIGRPSAASMDALGRLVAEQVGDEEVSRITVTVAPSSGALGEVTLDVVGSEDDSVRGVRLVVFGEPLADGFSLRTVEQMVLCGRGVTQDGFCL